MENFDPGAALVRNVTMFDMSPAPGASRQRSDAAARVRTESNKPGMTQRRAAVTITDGVKWADLLARVAHRQDTDAFATLFEHFAPRVKAFLIKSGADPALAEECAQDVMVTVWNKAAQFDPSRASVATWVFTIARNRRIDMLRRDRRPEPEDLPWGPEPEPDQVDALVLQQESERLITALAELPERQRVMIERAYFGDLTHNEIAEETGLPLGTIKSRIRLALERLRHSLS